MLRVALAELRAGAVETEGEVAPDDPLLDGAEARLVEPLRVTGRLSAAGEGRYYWRVTFVTTARMECRRCLAPVDVPVRESAGLIFAPRGAGSDESCYLIPERTHVLDLSEALREEFLLALPRFVECRSDCRGLCPRCGANLNEGPCGCAPAADSRWDALRALTRTDPEKD
jgi:uncharacterized protein